MRGVDVDVALGVDNAWLAGAQGPGNIVVGIALLSVDLLRASPAVGPSRRLKNRRLGASRR